MINLVDLATKILTDISASLNNMSVALNAGGPGSGRHKDFFKEQRLAEQRRLAIAKRQALAKEGKSARGKEIISDKAKRSLKSMAIARKEDQDIAEETEHTVANTVHGIKQPDNSPFDILVKDRQGRMHGIEVKALIFQKNDKITMSGNSISKKNKFAKRNKLFATHTVAVDYRGGKASVLHRSGVGSFRIANMDKVKGGLNDLAAHMNLK